MPAWPASSQSSKAAAWSGGPAGPTATRSNPILRAASLTCRRQRDRAHPDDPDPRRASTTRRLWVSTRPPSATNRSHVAQRPSGSQRARKSAVARMASGADANRRDLLLDLEALDGEPAGAQHGPRPLGLIGEARRAARLPPLIDVEGGERQDAARRQPGAGPCDDRIGHAEVGDHHVRRTERPIVGLLGVGDHEDDVGVPGPVSAPAGLDERPGVRVDPDDAPGAGRQMKGQASGPRADVEDGPALERLRVEPGVQSRRDRSVTAAAFGRAPARLRQIASHAGASCPEYTPRGDPSRCGSRLLPVET